MTLGSRVAIPVLIGFSLAARTLSAQTPPSEPVTETSLADAVVLKNGSFLRGLVVELEPASHVSLRLPNGELRRIPIAEVASIERAGKPVALGVAPATTATAAPAGTAAAAVAPVPAPVAPPAAAAQPQSELDRILAGIPGPRIRLEAHANRPAFLERRIGDDQEGVVAYHLVCKVPCSVELPAADTVPYRIGMARFEPTDWFALPKYDAHVKAELVSAMYPVWMRSMLVGGFVFGVTGGAFYGINELSGKKEWARDTGFVLMGLGGACFVASGLFWLFSPHTSYVIEKAH